MDRIRRMESKVDNVSEHQLFFLPFPSHSYNRLYMCIYVYICMHVYVCIIEIHYYCCIKKKKNLESFCTMMTYVGIIFEELFARILVFKVNFLFQVFSNFISNVLNFGKIWVRDTLIRHKLEKCQILIFEIDFFVFRHYSRPNMQK
jgi:hypothetical protein